MSVVYKSKMVTFNFCCNYDQFMEYNISRNTATRKMNALVKQGLFERKGKGLSVYFKI